MQGLTDRFLVGVQVRLPGLDRVVPGQAPGTHEGQAGHGHAGYYQAAHAGQVGDGGAWDQEMGQARGDVADKGEVVALVAKEEGGRGGADDGDQGGGDAEELEPFHLLVLAGDLADPDEEKDGAPTDQEGEGVGLAHVGDQVVHHVPVVLRVLAERVAHQVLELVHPDDDSGRGGEAG